MVSELHTFLTSAGVSTPVVFVGQGLGGLNVQLYASQYPSDVAGLVLVDAQTQEQYTRYWSLYPPEALRTLRDWLHEAGEGVDLDAEIEALALLRAAPPSLGDRPLVVLTHGGAPKPMPGMAADLVEKLERIWQEMQAGLPRLSTNSAQLVAAGAAWIPSDAPELVVGAVREVLSSTRTGTPVKRAAIYAAAQSAEGFAPAQLGGSTSAAPVTDGMVDVGGRRLHVHCAGEGTPLVVLDAGLGRNGTDWRFVQRRSAASRAHALSTAPEADIATRPRTPTGSPRSLTSCTHCLHMRGLRAHTYSSGTRSAASRPSSTRVSTRATWLAWSSLTL
jgi:hypothetical protein